MTKRNENASFMDKTVHVILFIYACKYLKFFPRVCVGHELAIIISYPTSASGIFVLLKTATKYREFSSTLFVKTTDFQFVFNFERTRTVAIFGEHGIMAHIPLWLSQSELSNCIIQVFSFKRFLFFFSWRLNWTFVGQARALCDKSHFSVPGFMSHEDTYEPVPMGCAKKSKTMPLCSNSKHFSQGLL